MSRWLVLLWVLVAPGFLHAQEDDDDDDDEPVTTPGLVGTYSSGEKSVRRLAPDLVGKWEGSPDPRLVSGEFTASWTGNLLVQQAGTYRFHATVDGNVELSVDGKSLLSGANSGGWLNSPPIDIPFGELPVSVKYGSQKDGHGVLKLFWSSDAFPIEPIPAHLFSIPNDEAALKLSAKAARWHDALRCARCHRGEQFELPSAGPSLTRIRNAISKEWIVQKLTVEPKASDQSKMPHFAFTEAEADEVASYLLSVAQRFRPKPVNPGKNPDADSTAGQRLVRTLGCLACHQVNEIGTAGAYAGGNLADVKTKRSVEWVHQWL
ncbi:MAG: PA14 domain-containing protein, partial [Planctomycetaceae bacterium]